MRQKFVGSTVGNFEVLEIVGYVNTAPRYKVKCRCGRTSIKRHYNIKMQAGCGDDCPFTLDTLEKKRLKQFKKINVDGKEFTYDELAQYWGITKSATYYRLYNRKKKVV